MSTENEPTRQFVRCPALREADTVTGRTVPPIVCAETGLSPNQRSLPSMYDICPIREAVGSVPCMIDPAVITVDAVVRGTDLKGLLENRPARMAASETTAGPEVIKEIVRERDLAEDARQGSVTDEQAWRRLIERTNEAARKGARIARDDARQTALLGLFRRYPELANNDADQSGLVYTATRHAALDIALSASSIHEVPTDRLTYDASVSGDFTATVVQRAALKAALSELKPIHRVILGMIYVQGMTVPEAAAELRIPRATAKSRLHYARKYLRACLKSTN